MAKKNQHVVPLGNGWAVKGEGNLRYTAITERKADATTVARTIAKNSNSELVIHGKDGRVQGKFSYGKDTNPPIDKVK